MPLYGFQIEVQGNAIKSINGISQGINQMERQSVSATGKISGLVKQLGAFAIASFGIYRIGAFIKKSSEYFNETRDAIVKLGLTLKSTQGKAGITFNDFIKDAEKLNKTTLFSRPSIIESESVLAVFTNIHKEMMDKLIPLTADFAAKFGVELKEAVTLVGRSFQDLNLERVARKTGKLSEKQEKLLKYYRDTNQQLKGQALLYDFISKKIGGTAKGIADVNQVKMAAKIWGDIKLKVGYIVDEIRVKLIPVIKKFVDIAGKGIEVIGGFLKEMYHWLERNWGLVKAIGIALAIAFSISILNKWVNILLPAIFTGLLSISKVVIGISIGFASWQTTMIMILGIILEIKTLFDLIKAGSVKTFYNKMMQPEIDELTKQHKELFKQIQSASGEEKNELTKHYKEIGKQLDDISKKREDFQKGNVFVSSFKALGLELKSVFETIKGVLPKSMDFGFDKMIAQLNALANGKTTNGITENALDTSDLAGVKGGLGEAKVISIRIDTVQKIDVENGDGKDIVNLSSQAIEVLIRALNNIAYNQSSTM